MEKQKGLHLVYKKLGETPLEAIQRLKIDEPESAGLPITYAGRLDPMAEGLLILLSGEEVHNKEKYNELSKTYEVEVLWGFETDTLDVLGLVKSLDPKLINLKVADLENALAETVRVFEQKYPAYSSKPVEGKSLFIWAREGKLGDIEIPSHQVEIFSSKFLNRRTIIGSDLLKEIKEKIDLVSGDFRQQETISKWGEELKDRLEEEFFLDKVELEVSSGFYVRQFVYDLAKSFNENAITFHIKRTKVGEYNLANI
ncbi:MAG: hypothetical protein V4690_00430 [Patescibacteria group bacterium]